MPEDTPSGLAVRVEESTTALVVTTLGTAKVSNQKDRLELVLGVMAIPVDSATTHDAISARSAQETKRDVDRRRPATAARPHLVRCSALENSPRSSRLRVRWRPWPGSCCPSMRPRSGRRRGGSLPCGRTRATPRRQPLLASRTRQGVPPSRRAPYACWWRSSSCARADAASVSRAASRRRASSGSPSARIRAASKPAFRAPPTPTVATGTPGGI